MINNSEFYDIIQEIAEHPVVLQMKNFTQHYDCNCYDHCMSVAYYSYLLSKKLNLDYRSSARARNVT